MSTSVPALRGFQVAPARARRVDSAADQWGLHHTPLRGSVLGDSPAPAGGLFMT